MTEKNDKRDEDKLKNPKVQDENGLSISYDKKEIEKYFPNLTSEILNKEKAIHIDSVVMEIEQKELKNDILSINQSIPDELKNPGAIDFIRRCTTNEEAIEILDFLVKRKELSIEECNKLKNQIMREGGLKKLIAECGGFKEPGYYTRKYYKKNLTSQESINKKKDTK